MRYTKYIAILFAFLAVACTTDDMEQQLMGEGNGNMVQFVGRVLPFADCNVATRAAKNEQKEYEVKSLHLLIFGNDGNCVYSAYSANGEVVFGIDRGTTDEDGEVNNGDFVGIDQSNLTSCTIYAVANFPELKESGLGKGDGKDDFMALETKVSGIDIPSTGMPMLGQYAGTIDLSVNSTIKGSTPFEVPMKALFSKMVFNIEVKATESLGGDFAPPQFMLEDFKVYNVAESVDFSGGTESSSGETTSSDDDETGTDDATPLIQDEDVAKVFQGAVTGSNIAIDGGSAVSFAFYLPERFIIPKTPADQYVYPFGQGTAIRPEDYNLRQRYKPLIAQDDATYVTFKGVFTNHQGHNYDVTYKIYVGNDNYSNFDIVRNRQYNNSILIKGIQNTSDQSSNQEAVSIDHRVNVERSLPIIVNLRRETLLDAHYEVRPLRIRANMNHELNQGGVILSNSAVKVTVEYNNDDTDKNWIGLERSYGDGQTVTDTYCSDPNKKSSHGKRRYFTTDLTTNTLAGAGSFANNGYSNGGGQAVVLPVKSENECVWIYVDECTDASTNIDAKRSATIKVIYGTIENGNFVASDDAAHTLEYVINQHKLYEVTTTRKEYIEGTSTFAKEGIYYIEHEEEYLHNFDSDDTFSDNKTEDQGMVWGLDGIQLSNLYDAAYLDYTAQGLIQTILSFLGWDYEDLVNEAFSSMNIKYDFYLIRDVESDETLKEHVEIRDFQGYKFNEQIVSYLLDNYADDERAKLKEIALDEQPQSAIAYCYNRNKRNADGSVPEQHWYLPAIDEIEDIMEKEYSSFNGVFQKNKYWSCQPAFNPTYLDLDIWQFRIIGWQWYDTGNQMTGYYYSDNVNRARATMAEYEAGVFKDVISSDSDLYGTQTGQARVNTGAEFIFNDYTPKNPSYDNHPGNLPRNDVNNKARVRCIRRMVTE